MDVCQLLSSREFTAPLLAACVAVAAWLGKSYVSGVLYYFSRYSDQIEILSALKSEILIIVEHVEKSAVEGGAEALEKIYKTAPEYKLFIPLFRETMVFDALRQNVTAITEKSLKKVIAFYNLSGGLDVVQTAMTGERFESFEPARRVNIYGSFLETAKAATDAGHEAISVIDSEAAIVRMRRALISLMSVILIAVAFLAASEAIQTVATCRYDKAPPAVSSDLWHDETISDQSDEGWENGSHFEPPTRITGAAIYLDPHIACAAHSFNPLAVPARYPRRAGAHYAAA